MTKPRNQPAPNVAPEKCPACSDTMRRRVTQWNARLPKDAEVYECTACMGIYGAISREDAERVGLVIWKWDATPNARPDEHLYFDFAWTYANGTAWRSHGWIDARSRAIVQVG